MPADPAVWTTLLVRYGELGIKSPSVRTRWEKRLVENLEAQMARRNVEGEVVRERGRIFVHVSDRDGALDAMRHTFGVVSASEVEKVPADLDVVTARLLAIARDAIPDGASFAVRARRTGEHAFTSMEVQRHVGAAVFLANEARGVRVDLGEPDVELHVEVRDDRAFLFRDVVPGPGGLPLGTQGRVVVVLDSPRAALAAWLVMKRGCTAILLVPADAAEDAATAEAARALDRWASHLKAIRVGVPDPFRADAAARRAFLLKAAGAVARPRKGQAVVVADGLEGAMALASLDALAGLPVFRPLTGYEGDALVALARAAEAPHVGPERAPPTAGAVEVPAEAVRDALRAQEAWP